MIGSVEYKTWQASDPGWEDDFVIVRESKSKKQKQYRIIIPFECKFTMQDITIQVRDESNFTILYESQVSFNLLTPEFYNLDKYMAIAVRESESSKFMQTQINFRLQAATDDSEEKHYESVQVCEIKQDQ